MKAHPATSNFARGRQGPKCLFCCKMPEVKLATFPWLHYTREKRGPLESDTSVCQPIEFRIDTGADVTIIPK